MPLFLRSSPESQGSGTDRCYNDATGSGSAAAAGTSAPQCAGPNAFLVKMHIPGQGI